jgi:hypothetical protein
MWEMSITFWTVLSPGMLRRVALVRTDVSEGCVASIIRVTRIGELGTTLAVTTYRSCQLLLTLFLPCWFLSRWCWRRYIPPKRRFLQEPHGITSKKAEFFMVTAVKIWNFTQHNILVGNPKNKYLGDVRSRCNDKIEADIYFFSLSLLRITI